MIEKSLLQENQFYNVCFTHNLTIPEINLMKKVSKDSI